MLLGLAMDFCEAVNDEEAPKIENSVNRVLEEETRVIQDDCYLEFSNTLDDEIGVEPLKDTEINAIIQKCV